MSNDRAFSRRALLGAGGAFAAMAGLSACGGNTGGLTGGDGTGGGSGAGLSQWYHQYGEAGTEEAAKRYASEYTDAEVTVNWVLGDYASKLSTTLLSGSGVDVFENNAIAVDQMEQGRYADLTSIVDPVKDQFNAAALSKVEMDGKFWGVPMLVDPQGFVYRPSVLEAAGIGIPETFEDLVAAATELTTADQKGLFLGNNFDACALALIWAGGGSPLTEDLSAVNYNTEGMATALSLIQQMKNDGVLLTGAPADWVDPAAFISGLVPISWAGCWILPAVEEAFGDDVGFFPLPGAGPNGATTTFVGTWNEQVAASSSQVEAATEFVKWLWIDQLELQNDWSLSYGFHIPPLTAAAEQAEALQSGNGKTLFDMTNDFGVTTPPQWTGDMATPMNDAISRVLKNAADPAAELAAAEEASNRAFSS
ncbi:ABC transporter substrate-binding protein [Pseudactinotalea sp.]|uniref:ABC transporter substrate-binding protein n=1 Tax=Pseudactinotalea sp. TaxID=1926260 RepID=UPI003B3AFA2E